MSRGRKMQVIETTAELRRVRRELRGSVGLVPTMGALHEGHLSLIQHAAQDNESVAATLFVNPMQFAANEDLARYPRSLAQDLALFEAAGTALVFVPTPQVMYPDGFETYVTVERTAQGLEAEHRPGHFRGVTTVVCKLFNLVQPDRAYFGQKDAQQVAVIRAMVRDLNFPLDVVVCPTVREPDGLAMSSRNRYLLPDERAAVPVLFRAISAASDAYDQGERSAERLVEICRVILNTEGLVHIEYVSVVRARTMAARTNRCYSRWR